MNLILDIQHVMHTHPVLAGICIVFLIVMGVAAWGEVPRSFDD